MNGKDTARQEELIVNQEALLADYGRVLKINCELRQACLRAADALEALERFQFYCYSCDNIKALVDKLREAAE